MTYGEILRKLKSMANPKNVEGMARFGINPKHALGINIPVLRKFAKDINHTFKGDSLQGKHKLAQELRRSKIHEARILASMVSVPELVTEKQMDSWIKDFDSWDICDQVCMNLFDKTPFAFDKAIEWSKKDEEFEKRAGYTLMACLTWHDKGSPDSKFVKFFPSIKRGSSDERNFVKKAVNWALRQIGKRNKGLNDKSIKLARDIIKSYPSSKSAQWIGNDALRELTGEKVQERLSVRSAQ